MIPEFMSEERLSLLTEVFTAVFELAPTADVRDVRRGTTTAWDSLGHVSLVTALESEFGVTIEVGDSMEIVDYESAAEILGELLAL